MKRFSLVFVLIIISTAYQFAQEPSKSVFYSEGNSRTWFLYQNNNRALYNIITNEAFRLLDERTERVSRLKTEKDWVRYRDETKIRFTEPLKKFQKTPLNARVTGKLERENFTVEKIVFESHPGFYVSSALFIPRKIKKPAPAVIYCSGHTELGFRSDVYQQVMINLVEKGFVVFAFDPIGQGERLQYVDLLTGKSKIGGPTTEHSYAGVQTLLTGTSLSDYFIWDGVRAIDYLETRKEVDAKRIGITGRSGGGTQSALIAAYDERIFAAAPECYITSFKRLLQSIGPQDAEQNPDHFIKNGFDHADFLHVRAPKPALIITTTHDFFSQQGARETFEEVKKSYGAFGLPGNIEFSVDFGKHESTKNNRERMYAFFQKQLQNPGDSTDLEVKPFSYDELLVTPTGQVATSLKGETVYSLNQKYFTLKNASKSDLKGIIKQTAGIEMNRKFTAAVFTGRFLHGDFEVKKYFLENNKKDFALPVYVISKPGLQSIKTLVWLPQSGKSQVLESPLLTEIINSGNTVISCDLPGVGELSDPEFRGDGFVQKVPFNYTFGANLAGKSIPGIQAEALDILIQFVQNDFQGSPVSAIAEGIMNTPLLLCSSNQNLFRRIVLIDPYESNRNLINTEYYLPNLAFATVPGSLPFFDFRDLIEIAPANSVKIINPVNASGENTKDYNYQEIIDFIKN